MYLAGRAAVAYTRYLPRAGRVSFPSGTVLDAPSGGVWTVTVGAAVDPTDPTRQVNMLFRRSGTLIRALPAQIPGVISPAAIRRPGPAQLGDLRWRDADVRIGELSGCSGPACSTRRGAPIPRRYPDAEVTIDTAPLGRNRRRDQRSPHAPRHSLLPRNHGGNCRLRKDERGRRAGRDHGHPRGQGEARGQPRARHRSPERARLGVHPGVPVRGTVTNRAKCATCARPRVASARVGTRARVGASNGDGQSPGYVSSASARCVSLLGQRFGAAFEPGTQQHRGAYLGRPLTIRVSVNPCTPAMWGPCQPVAHRYTLTCAPPAGTMPHPQTACAALADYEAYLKSKTGPTYICRGLIGRPTATAVVSGTYAGEYFLLKLDNESWCGESTRVMHDYWALSTFPCSVVVIHTQSIQPYSSFAHASGCLSSAAVQGGSDEVGRGTWIGLTRAAAIRAAAAWLRRRCRCGPRRGPLLLPRPLHSGRRPPGVGGRLHRRARMRSHDRATRQPERMCDPLAGRGRGRPHRPRHRGR